MSTRYPGGVITKTPVVPAGPYETGAAPGIWTLDQQLQAQKAGIWPLAGNVPPYIEDVFSTYLYTGNGSTQTITNGIDLSGKGGLVWLKSRGSVQPHWFVDTARGVNKRLESNNTNAESTLIDSFPSFNADGFTLGTNAGNVNTNGVAQCSWTFREQPKFFDVVTYTGDGTSARAINHNLGSAPGMIVVKCTNDVSNWPVYHRSLGATKFVLLNKTDEAFSSSSYWANTEPTSTQFSVGFTNNQNSSGQTYVAYLFAHNAGGFGLTGTDNVISCGSYTGNGTTENNVTLGYEPQWVLIKDTTTAYKWLLMDNMRGFQMGTSSAVLSPNSSDAETANGAIQPSATGFTLTGGGGFLNGSGDTYIYIAIRRGPMKVPTSGTSVFEPIARTGTGATATVTGVGFAPDLIVTGVRNTTNYSATTSRLAGPGTAMFMPYTQAENTGSYADTVTSFNMNGVSLGSDAGGVCNGNLNTYINWFFQRAPGFFDVVCYTGTGANRTVTHNLAAVPELMIVKQRSAANAWVVYAAPNGNTGVFYLNDNGGYPQSTYSGWWQNTNPTASVFSVGDANAVNQSGVTFVSYLFATVAGVSKVGSYTGTGTTQTINCGFTAGARFVLIKRTDSTGDWYVWDSARGIVAGNDPYLLLNSTAAEVTGTDYVDTASSGFEISSTAPAAINANGGSFIFLAIA